MHLQYLLQLLTKNQVNLFWLNIKINLVLCAERYLLLEYVMLSSLFIFRVGRPGFRTRTRLMWSRTGFMSSWDWWWRRRTQPRSRWVGAGACLSGCKSASRTCCCVVECCYQAVGGILTTYTCELNRSIHYVHRTGDHYKKLSHEGVSA